MLLSDIITSIFFLCFNAILFHSFKNTALKKKMEKDPLGGQWVQDSERESCLEQIFSKEERSLATVWLQMLGCRGENQ